MLIPTTPVWSRRNNLLSNGWYVRFEMSLNWIGGMYGWNMVILCINRLSASACRVRHAAACCFDITISKATRRILVHVSCFLILVHLIGCRKPEV